MDTDLGRIFESGLIEFSKKTLRHLSHPLEALVIVFKYATHSILLAVYGARMRRHYHPSRIFGVIPRAPLPLYTLWGIAQVLGLTFVSRPSERTMLFVDITTLSKTTLPKNASEWLNGTCLDTSKTHVAKTFASETGRSLAVDPRVHRGPMVEKSEENGSHDGRIVEGPLENFRRGCAYQRLIDNTTDEGAFIEDFRTVIVGEQIPLVYRKRRPFARRFEGGSITAEFCDAQEIFSDKERQDLLAISRALGLDFGELDVLRDRADGEIYVVDANKTSISPPISLPFSRRLEALKIVATAFEAEFLGGKKRTS